MLMFVAYAILTTSAYANGRKLTKSGKRLNTRRKQMARYGIEVGWFEEQLESFFRIEYTRPLSKKELVVALSWWLYDHLPRPLDWGQQVSEE